MRPNAAHDIPWLLGMGATSFASEAGLRSAFGAQLFAAQNSQMGGSFDLGVIEDRMLSRCSAATQARAIVARLSQLSRVQVDVLRLHFDPKLSLPYGILTPAVMLASARKLVTRQLYAACREELKAIRKAHDLVEVHDHLGRFIKVRTEARHSRAQAGRPVALGVLRAAIHEASSAERKAIADQVTIVVQAAIDAYESTVLPDDRGRTVFIEDPRPWKR